jgi:hypothetical protein
MPEPIKYGTAAAIQPMLAAMPHISLSALNVFVPCLSCQGDGKLAIFASEARRVLTRFAACSNNISIAKPKGGHDGDSLLYEVQKKGGNKKPEPRHTQERQTGNARCLSGLQHQGIQNR